MRMFIGHGIAMIVMLIGVVLGVILAITDDWKTGLIVGVIVFAAGAILAVINMMWFASRIEKQNSAAFADFDKKFGQDWPKF